MSYTELYSINKKGDVSFYTEFKNSHLGAPFIWNIISNKFYNKNYYEFMDLNSYHSEFWKTIDREDCPLYIKYVFDSTFDNVVMLRKDFIDLKLSFIEFLKEEVSLEEQNISHISEYIKTLQIIIQNEDIIGICWNQTSINANPWISESDDDTPYNIYNDTKHYIMNQK